MDDGGMRLPIPLHKHQQTEQQEHWPHTHSDLAQTQFLVPHYKYKVLIYLLKNLHMVCFELVTSVWQINIQSHVSEGV